MAYKLGQAWANAALDGARARFNTGFIRIYSGTEPATAGTALSGNTLLAELTTGNPATGAAASNTLTFNAITQDASADATGTATFFRIFNTDGTTVEGQGSVGVSGADLNINSVSIVAGGTVSITSGTITLPLA